MTTATPAPAIDAPSPQLPRLGLRARLLLQLERLFPTVAAPATSDDQSTYEYAKASASFARHADELGGLAGKRILDFGCGWGGETAWLAERAAHATGVDISQDALDQARRYAQQRNLTNLDFALIDDHRLPLPDNTFDAVFSTNVFEHVMNPRLALTEIHRVLKPGGRFITTFGPLFYSPLGYHVPWATQVPFAHLAFGLKPILQLCHLKRGPVPAHTWEDTGLNRITFSAFRQAVHAAGFQTPRLRRIPVRRLKTLAATPILGNLLTFGIDCHLAKPV